MSSAETLNFGPQWLRALSEGSGMSSFDLTSLHSQTVPKFKLAEKRYGREEMLALFLGESDIPDELHRAPSLVSEMMQVPLALRPLSEHSQPQLQSSYRSRNGNGRSVANRGRGRGRGNVWSDHDDGAVRRPPLLKRAVSEDWRSDSLRGKGDGAEDIIKSLKEWRTHNHKTENTLWNDEWCDTRHRIEQQHQEGYLPSSKETEKDDLIDATLTDSIENLSSNTVQEDLKREKEVIEVPIMAKHAHTKDYPLLNSVDLGKTGLDTVTQNDSGQYHLEQLFQKLTTSDMSDETMQATTGEYRSEGSETIDGKPDQLIGSSYSFDVPSDSSLPQLKALSSTWCYKDPQGDIQGPFSSTQMLEWLNAGYFTMGLLVKRCSDAEFTSLGELIKRVGRIPFATSLQNIPLPSCLTTKSGIKASLDQRSPFDKMVNERMLLPGGPSLQPSQMPYFPNINFELIIRDLVKNPEFCHLSQFQQQLVLMKYANHLEPHSLSPATFTFGDSMMLRDGANQPCVLQQNMLNGSRQKEEEDLLRIQMQQENRKKQLQKQEEEYRMKEELLLKQEEELKILQLRAERKKEQIQREIENDKMKKLLEMREKENEQKLIKEDMREKQGKESRAEEQQKEENESKEEWRKLQAEGRKCMKTVSLEGFEQTEVHRQKQQIMKEKQLQGKRESEAGHVIELPRKAEVEIERIEKMETVKNAMRKKQQEKQLQQSQLPHHSKWGHGQSQDRFDSVSLLEIQKSEEKREISRMEEKTKTAREMKKLAAKAKSGWGFANQDVTGMSLLDIQQEEAKKLSSNEATVTAKSEASKPITFGSSWSKQLRIQPDLPKQAKLQSLFWDQVVEQNPQKLNSIMTLLPGQHQQQSKQPKSKRTKASEEQHIKALFQQQIAKDRFTDWCENYLRQMSVGSIDIPTFVNFLRDVESPYEVQEYIQSYLGESNDAKRFGYLFLEERSKMSSPNMVGGKPRSSTKDTDGFEIVTSNTKRGRKKIKRKQWVDPSILGFSVNAASDRVNMGEIQTADD